MKKIYFTLLIVGQIVFAQNKVEKDTTKSQELENILSRQIVLRLYAKKRLLQLAK